MADPDQSEPDGATNRSTKVARVIDEYGLAGEGEQLEAWWTADGPERKSLRELATYLNERIIESALSSAGASALPGEVESVHSVLTGDDASTGVEQEIRGRLRREGIDIDALETDLVSYQAIRTYLKRERGATYTEPETDPVESTREQIQRLQGRVRAVSEQRLASLGDGDHLTLGEHNVLVQVQVYCEDCGRQYSVEELLDRGGCDCEDSG